MRGSKNLKVNSLFFQLEGALRLIQEEVDSYFLMITRKVEGITTKVGGITSGK